MAWRTKEIWYNKERQEVREHEILERERGRICVLSVLVKKRDFEGQRQRWNMDNDMEFWRWRSLTNTFEFKIPSKVMKVSFFISFMEVFFMENEIIDRSKWRLFLTLGLEKFWKKTLISSTCETNTFVYLSPKCLLIFHMEVKFVRNPKL